MYRESFPAYEQLLPNHRPRGRGGVVVGHRHGQALSGVEGFPSKSSLTPFSFPFFFPNCQSQDLTPATDAEGLWSEIVWGRIVMLGRRHRGPSVVRRDSTRKVA